jgi:excinuclease UvrABC helicase subunit UvrB
MKKHLILSTLLLIVGYNLIGFMAAFHVVRLEWRQSVRVELAKISETDLVRFVFSKNKMDISEKEFTHEGKYYDILRAEIKGDSVEIYCFDDATETRLTNEFSNLILNKTSQDTDYQHKTSFCFQLLIKDFYFPSEKIKKKDPSVSSRFRAVFSYKNRFFPPYFIPTDTPPPNTVATKLAS